MFSRNILIAFRQSAGWKYGAAAFALLLSSAVTLPGCNRSLESGLMMDPNGFVLGGDNAKTARPLYVGVGDSPERLIAHNPYLKDFIWIPQPDDEMGGCMPNRSMSEGENIRADSTVNELSVMMRPALGA